MRLGKFAEVLCLGVGFVLAGCGQPQNLGGPGVVVVNAPPAAVASKPVDPSQMTEDDWRKVLSPEEFRVCRAKGTERAYSGKYWDHHADGEYHCVACGEKLFASDTKFDSGTGWPSFFKPAAGDVIAEHDDVSGFSRRTEVTCKRCGSHLGHVFDDGPEPTGLRYCINSIALKFQGQPAAATPPAADSKP